MISMEVANNLSCCKLAWRPILRRRGGARGGGLARASGEASGRDHRGGRLVDENMIVLRLRVREMKNMLEKQQGPPSDWMEWEKQYYGHYDEDVCEAIGLLQSYLMSVRPRTALGMVALVALSVLISSGVVFFQVLDIAKSFLSCLGYI